MKYQSKNFVLHLLQVLLILFCFHAFSTPHAAAQDAYITDLFVTNSSTDLLLYLNVQDCFTEEIETGNQNGIPATFTFFVELYQERKALPDKKIAEHTFFHTLTFDSLKDEYNISLSEKDTSNNISSIAEARLLMTEANGFKVTELNKLRPDRSYRLRVKVKLAKKTLPLYVHYLIPFSSLWDFETDWHSLEFRY